MAFLLPRSCCKLLGCYFGCCCSAAQSKEWFLDAGRTTPNNKKLPNVSSGTFKQGYTWASCCCCCPFKKQPGGCCLLAAESWLPPACLLAAGYWLLPLLCCCYHCRCSAAATAAATLESFPRPVVVFVVVHNLSSLTRSPLLSAGVCGYLWLYNGTGKHVFILLFVQWDTEPSCCSCCCCCSSSRGWKRTLSGRETQWPWRTEQRQNRAQKVANVPSETLEKQ